MVVQHNARRESQKYSSSKKSLKTSYNWIVVIHLLTYLNLCLYTNNQEKSKKTFHEKVGIGEIAFPLTHLKRSLEYSNSGRNYAGHTLHRKFSLSNGFRGRYYHIQTKIKHCTNTHGYRFFKACH